jgi:hypothetical protein
VRGERSNLSVITFHLSPIPKFNPLKFAFIFITAALDVDLTIEKGFDTDVEAFDSDDLFAPHGGESFDFLRLDRLPALQQS